MVVHTFFNDKEVNLLSAICTACGVPWREGNPPGQQIVAGVPHADGGSDGPTFGQQLSEYCAAGSFGCAGSQNFRINHW